MAEIRSGFSVANFLALLTHLVILVNLILPGIWLGSYKALGGFASKNKYHNYKLSLHALFNLFGFSVAMAAGFMAFRAWPVKRNIQKIIHVACQVTALVFAMTAFGMMAMYLDDISGREHFHNPHAWIGLLTYLLLLVQVLGMGIITGIGVLNPTKYKSLMTIHRLLGLTTYLCSSIALVSGLQIAFDFVAYVPAADPKAQTAINLNMLSVAVAAICVFVVHLYEGTPL